MRTRRPATMCVALLSVLGVVQACAKANQPEANSAPPPASSADHQAADEAAIRATDSAWNAAVAAKDTDRAASYYADGASIFVPCGPLATGKDAIRTAWKSMLATPGFALTFTPDKITVIGDGAYEIGDYSLTTAGKGGKPHTAKGKYIVVWRRQPDGTWKALVDAPTTTT